MSALAKADGLMSHKDGDLDADRRSGKESGKEGEKGFRSSQRLSYSSELQSPSAITRQVTVRVKVD
jgi:hypothetical protein